MTDYVVGLIFNSYSRDILLLEKLKPEWQAGKLNGIGGKIEKDESPLEAMKREYQEEVVEPTGIDLNIVKWKLFLTWNYGDGLIYFFRTYTKYSLHHLEAHHNDVGEMFVVWNMEDILCALDKGELINNLYWIIPCAMFKKDNEHIKVTEYPDEIQT